MIFQVHHCDWFWRSGQSIINIYTDHRQWMSHSTLQLRTKSRKNITNMKISVVFVMATVTAIWLGKSIHLYFFIFIIAIKFQIEESCYFQNLLLWCELIKEQSAKKVNGKIEISKKWAKNYISPFVQWLQLRVSGY